MGKKKILSLLVVALAVVLIAAYRDSASNEAWRLAHEDYLLAQKTYEDNVKLYRECIDADWPSPEVAAQKCYTTKVAMDDAHADMRSALLTYNAASDD
ncbi:hypothetical protein [Lelliottia nimipressuralis]|uniref:Uncharacterized protein n=1 Tax=Lelliottia nimipressuralis TaxID=69220 RepID=A0ABD4KGM2_9ENTR|nr:hypothetical protein [Lelliottia nimipressuralis]MBF4179679.1 hypothetical protein [Lelliottia nimipressuralis]